MKQTVFGILQDSKQNQSTYSVFRKHKLVKRCTWWEKELWRKSLFFQCWSDVDIDVNWKSSFLVVERNCSIISKMSQNQHLGEGRSSNGLLPWALRRGWRRIMSYTLKWWDLDLGYKLWVKIFQSREYYSLMVPGLSGVGKSSSLASPGTAQRLSGEILTIFNAIPLLKNDFQTLTSIQI